MSDEIASAPLQRLLGINMSVLNELVANGIVLRGEKRGTYKLEPSVSGYCEHLREQAAGRGGAMPGSVLALALALPKPILPTAGGAGSGSAA